MRWNADARFGKNLCEFADHVGVVEHGAPTEADPHPAFALDLARAMR